MAAMFGFAVDVSLYTFLQILSVHSFEKIPVEAHERRIVRPLIDLQHVFHVGDKGRAGVRRDHPLLLAMRFENVFFSVRPIVNDRALRAFYSTSIRVLSGVNSVGSHGIGRGGLPRMRCWCAVR
jgi:hypothetical protein